MIDILERMIQIAAEAAAMVAEAYEKPFSIDYKGPDDPVTTADRGANELICRRLSEAFPHVPIVAEESPQESWQHFRSSQHVFFVDPVDGTREFIARNGEFVVMIGLLEDDVPTHGVVHAPAHRTAWAGRVGYGAFELREDGSRTPLEVSRQADLARASVVSSRSHRSSVLEQALEHLAPESILTLGSAGLKGVAVARGQADVYMAPEKAGSLWDACAPHAIVRAAGGLYTDARGQAINYRAERVELNDGVVAANPTLHDHVLRRLRTFHR